MTCSLGCPGTEWHHGHFTTSSLPCQVQCNWATADAGDTVLGPTALHLSTLHTSTHLVPGGECSSRPPRVAPAAQGWLANVARGHRKHRVVLGFWSQKSACRDLQTLPGWMQSMQVRALRTRGDSAPRRLAVMPSFLRQPTLPPQAVFAPRE